MRQVKVVDGVIVKYMYTNSDLKQEHHNVSFPANITEKMLADYDVYPVLDAPEPNFDALTQRVEESDTPIFKDGAWYVVWNIVDFTPEERHARELKLIIFIRNERDAKLKNGIDAINIFRWNEMSGEKQTAWATYRTELLDITDQSGFPHNVNWPIRPV
jgi:hypothetical protein|tara:strand:- start:1721 stop:2197 length:477 start_codon:yes stop_codon:yes gene_type:complete